MPATLQDVLVAALALVAAGWLARRAWRKRNRPTPCDGCPGCSLASASRGAVRNVPFGVLPASRDARPTTLVQIQGVAGRP